MNSYNGENVIETLRKFELTIAELYILYGTIFPADCDRWIGFAEKEIIHAKWLSVIKYYLDRKIISLKLTTVSIQSINEAVEYIQNQVGKAKLGKVDLMQALIVALEIDDLALKNSFCNIFNFSNQTAEKIKRNLSVETRGNREEIVMWLDRLNDRRSQAA